MSKLLFNINDLALVLVITASLLQAGIFAYQYRDQKYNVFLSCFLVSIAVASLDSLIYWSVVIKSELAAYSPHIFFAFKASIFLQPVLLYFYIKSVIYYDFKFVSKHIFHFLPAALYLFAIPLIYLSLGEKALQEGLDDYAVLFADPVFKTFMWGSKVSYLVYGYLSLRALTLHGDRLKNALSSTKGVTADWLKVLVVGFVVLWLWGTIAQFLTQINLSGHTLSLIKNYAYLLLIVTLIFLSLSRARATHQQSSEDRGGDIGAQAYTEVQVSRIEDAMVLRQAYLDPDFSLDKLSHLTSLPKRLVSSIVNGYFDKNFFEFVNSFRVEHAKKLLSDIDDPRTMIEVMADSGFNSKSAFNRFFKKITAMTPTQYRLESVASHKSKP